MADSIFINKYSKLQTSETTRSREELWDRCLENQNGINNSLTYIEFGVFEGYSIRYFSNKNNNQNSVFIGLDTFEGLPENWTDMPKGHFNLHGVTPSINDKRVIFYKGMFQDTWDQVSESLAKREISKLIVHYDADLYSSTLFALSKVDSLKKSYIAIFDEFDARTHEPKALYDYCQAYMPSVEFLYSCLFNDTPRQVACLITPRVAH